MSQCNCDDSLENLGQKKCSLQFGELYGIIYTPTYASDGSRNKIADGDTVNEAYLEAKINNADPSKRWYPVYDIDNVENIGAEADMFTTESGRQLFLNEGLRSISAKLFGASNRVVGKLNSIRCTDVSIYLVDVNRTIMGKYDGTDLLPARLSAQTFQALFTFAKTKTIQDVMMKFQLDRLEKDTDWMGLTLSEMANADVTLIPALLDVNVVISVITSTGFTATLTGYKDTFGSETPIVGWVKDNFILTKSTPITITSVIETSDGVYVFVVPTATGNHTLTKAAEKLGYEMPSTTVAFA